ncbi:UNVERIFIED_CONTAM: putative methyltransferase, chloroplastic [Sesamum calycinum]|uniref:Methyltransferase, chloroplastic n=1 Tax=Sesamum calycinum TaxID=2727403 RepID=A0AAW2QM48_9LAMI
MAKLMGLGNNLSSVSGALLPCQHSFNPMRCCLRVVKSSMSIPARIHGRLFTHEVRASSAGVVETKPDPVVDGTKLNIRKNILACPICYERLIWNGDPELSLESVARSTLQCSTCRKTYSGEASHLDLTITGRGKVYGDPVAASTEIFRSPLVSFSMKEVGDKVFHFGVVFLAQRKRNLILVRADISRLPFASSTVDAVHAGAALHCWPSPSAGVAEISRVLKPGGMFVASTYIADGLFSYIPLRGALRENIAQFSGSHVFLSETELEDLCKSCGLINFTCTRNRYFFMLSAMKPV